MAEKKGKKLRRQSKGKVYYSMGPARTSSNQKRRMRKHIRSHPRDADAVKKYEKKFVGRASDLGLNSKGRKRAIRSARVAA